MKQVKLAIAMMFVSLAAVIGWQVVKPSDEPVCRGKMLTQWLEDYLGTNSQTQFFSGAEQDAARAAVLQIGTNALPTLLRLCRTKDPLFKSAVMSLLARQHLFKVRFQPADHWRRLGYAGFYLLGSSAQGAVPALIQILSEDTSPGSKRCATLCLAAIGPPAAPAIPHLLQCAAAQDTTLKLDAQQALLHISLEATLKAGLSNLVWTEFPP